MNNTEDLKKNLEIEEQNQQSNERFMEFCIDHDHVTISIERFEELLRAETTLGLARKAYAKSESYTLTDMLSILLAPEKKQSGKDEDPFL